mmetsp:Transcript_56108/g.88957  ORF Transcript_56108/g.88957 Transcript_56108/m.88957 type:complete len:200 (-) Transcript_56108:38-637(-)
MKGRRLPMKLCNPRRKTTKGMLTQTRRTVQWKKTLSLHSQKKPITRLRTRVAVGCAALEVSVWVCESCGRNLQGLTVCVLMVYSGALCFLGSVAFLFYLITRESALPVILSEWKQCIFIPILNLIRSHRRCFACDMGCKFFPICSLYRICFFSEVNGNLASDFFAHWSMTMIMTCDHNMWMLWLCRSMSFCALTKSCRC